MYLIRQKLGSHKTKIRKKSFQPAAGTNYRFFLERFPAVVDLNTIDIGDFDEIRLAGRTIPAGRLPDWSYIYDDIEDTFALNRFGWLLTSIHTHPAEKLALRAREWITHWIDTLGENFEHPAWESYSVSERLANWPFILRMIERLQPLDKDEKKQIAASLGVHIDYLLRNLELRGEFTNNHILNNARGLYIGGLAIAHENAVARAKKLFSEWTPKLFLNDGMLKSGSSHYQFLLCQRFEQVYLLSHHAEDVNFTAFMEKWTTAIQGACDLFKVKSGKCTWTIPLIGDISPDYRPLWFLPLSKDGWETIRSSYIWKKPIESSQTPIHVGTKTVSEGFYRYDRDDATVFWPLPEGPVSAGSHAHFDVGSFVFFLKGNEIFTDSGRRSYSADGSTGASAAAHNCLLIDGLGPFCEDPFLNLFDAYPNQVARVVVAANQDDRPILSLDAYGFRRLASPVSWKRTFTFKRNAMTIRDDIEASGVHRLETKFIIAHGLSSENTDEGVRIKTENGQVTLKVLNPHGGRAPSFSMQKVETSRAYGHSAESSAFVVKNAIQGNHTNEYELRWQA